MQKGNLIREQAIALVGIGAVEAVESKNCEQTCRVGYNGACQGDDLIEWSASVQTLDGSILRAYYYTTTEEIEEAGGDLSNVDWTIAGYEVA